MVMTYRLTPINLNHDSWQRSKEKQAAKVLAYDCADARCKVARATEILGADLHSPKERYAKLTYEKTPWELPDVTSCEPDNSGAPMPANHIVMEDGRRLPIYPNHGQQKC